tara:strand:+ start:3953 stop:5200 length:1248 start_codon:yes stop_codon:yes gene_type:complete
MSKILIIDDEIEICKQVSMILSKNGYEASYVTSSKELSILLNDNFNYDLVLVDLWLKNSNKQGIDIIEQLKRDFNNLIIISFSGHANIDNAIESVKAGANDFIEKPFETKKLIHIIQKNLLELKQRVTINTYRNQISFHSKINAIGFGEYIDQLIHKTSKIKFNTSILLHGPSGVGKNYLANTIHMNLSSNNPDTFINMNENLMNESDLLKFNSLHNYFTIYLNDYEKFNTIELLNYLNLVKSKSISASIIFDTKNPDFDDPILKKLDYNIEIKALNKRKNEIIYLFKHYINAFSKKKFDRTIELDDEISSLLNNHNWPGNVFEIMNICENITNSINKNNEIITKENVEKVLNSSTKSADIYDLSYKEAKDKFEKEYFLQKLKTNNWNMTMTAKMLKLDRVSLYRKIKSLNIKLD